MTLADLVREASEQGRRSAADFAGTDRMARDALPWTVIAAFDADVRGHVERDPRIEDERDRVLVTAVKLAELRSDDAAEIAGRRRDLVEAIGYLEQAVLRFGIVNRKAARLGYGNAGEPVAGRD